jgi:hypothetical protein
VLPGFAYLNECLSWTQLGELRDSFFSRVLTALSLAALVIVSAAPKLDEIGLSIDVGTARIVYIGGLLFVAGYVGYALLAPVELRRPGQIDEIVGRMMTLADWQFFESRRRLATHLLQTERMKTFFSPPDHAKVFLAHQLGLVDAFTEKSPWKDSAPALYHADLNLRQFTSPGFRFLVAALLAAGSGAVLFPTIRSVTLALVSFWPGGGA